MMCMKKENLRIVFMGTPSFAVESLRLLVERNYTIAGVVTMPDKPAGRGHKVQYSPVKMFALEHNLHLLQPERLKDDDFVSQLKELNADVQIVVAFRMLPQVVWDMPRYGTFNLHASLLPHYRGAAPINWAIIKGEQETGATTFFLTHEIDTGKIILQNRIAISDNDNAGTIHDRLMIMGAEMVVETVDRIISGNMEAIDQQKLAGSAGELKTAPKIYKETCELKADMSVEEAHNLIRGLSPYPTAWVNLQLPGQTETISLKVFESEKDLCSSPADPGIFVTDYKKRAGIALKDGVLWFLSVQAPAKKRMTADEWLRGLRL